MSKQLLVTVLVVGALSGTTGGAQQPRAQVLDENGAPVFKVDPFWPKPLPNRWSMQQVTGIHVDHDGPHLVPESRCRCRRRRDRRRRQPAADRLLRPRTRSHRARSGGQRGPCLGRPGLSPSVADRVADGHRRLAKDSSGLAGRRRRTASSSSRATGSSSGTSAIVRRQAAPFAGEQSADRRPRDRKGGFSSTRSPTRSTSSTRSACSCTT